MHLGTVKPSGDSAALQNVVEVQLTFELSLLGCHESWHAEDAQSAQVSPHTQCMRAWWRRWSSQTGQSSLTRPTSNRRVAQYNTYDARTFFSDLLRRVRAGEEIVIAHAGNPIAKLVPYRRPIETRPGVVRMTVFVNDATTASEAAGPTPTRSSPAASTSRRARPD